MPSASEVTSKILLSTLHPLFAFGGILRASQFLKLADVVKQVLEKEELTGLFEPLNSGPEATARFLKPTFG